MKTPKLWLRNILKGSALTASLFIFQACYGMPQGWDDIYISFKVITESRDGIPGIKVDLEGQSITTDQSGTGGFTLHDRFNSGDVTLKFFDPSGRYASRDTSLSTEITDHVFDFKLNEQH